MDVKCHAAARSGLTFMSQPSSTSPDSSNRLRTLLVLGRVSNLPTVWSNCLAGAIIGGGATLGKLLQFTVAGTLIYTAGMYLNDAFDEQFDRENRSERPIPSGQIGVSTVWTIGIILLVAGFILGAALGKSTATLTLLLCGSVLLYDAVHKLVLFSPILMAFCRFFLFLGASSIGFYGVTGLAVWSALVLAIYVASLTYVAKSESTRGALKYWPCYLMAAPLVLAWIINKQEFRSRSIAFSIILVLWAFRALRTTFWSTEKNIGRTISSLLAGIVLVDLLATLGGPTGGPNEGVIFLALFLLALWCQRFVPAT